MLTKNKAQMMSEYAIIITTVAIALMVMSVYVKRAIQARMKGAHEFMFTKATQAHSASGASGEVLREYEPYYGDSQQVSSRNAMTKRELTPGGMTGVSKITIDVQSEAKSESITAPPKESN